MVSEPLSIQTTILENGVEVVTVNDPNLKALYQVLYIARGDEPEGERGSMHFIEHVLARTADMIHGTTKIISKICPEGGYGAWTNPMGVYFSALTMPDKADQGFDVLSKNVFPGKLLQEAVDMEAGLFRNELFETRFSAHTRSGRLQRWLLSQRYPNSTFLSSFFGQNDIQSVDHLDISQLESIYRRNFCGANLLYFVVGDQVNHQDAVERARHKFSHIPQGVRAVTPDQSAPVPYTSVVPRLPIVKPVVELSFPSSSSQDPNISKLELLALMLNASDSPFANLIRVRHKKYKYGCEIAFDKHTSFLTFRLTEPHSKIGPMFKDVVSFIRDHHKWLTPEFFEDMRARALVNRQFSLLADPKQIRMRVVGMAERHKTGGDALLEEKITKMLEKLTFDEFRMFVENTFSSLPNYVVHKPIRFKKLALPSYKELMADLGIKSDISHVRCPSYTLEFMGVEYGLAKRAVYRRAVRIARRYVPRLHN